MRMSISKHPLFVEGGDSMDLPIDRALVQRMQASYARAVTRGDALADRFYARLFTAHPEVRSLFPDDMTEQKDKLFATLSEVVMHLADPRASKRVLEDLGREHAGFGAREEHYPLVCEALVGALAEISGDDWNADLDRDWRRMLAMLSAIMIEAARQRTS